LAEVKHKGELELWHPESLAHGRHLHIMIHWKNRWATAHPLPCWTSAQQACWAATSWSAGPPPTGPPGQNSPKLLPTSSPGHCPTGLLGHHPPARQDAARLLAHWLLPTTEGLQHHQMPAPNLPRKRRQTGPDAEGVTPEVLRLKFYSSWPGIFVFFFLFLKCLFVLFAVWLSTISPCWFC
jgi:hypothetical protein